MGRLATKEEIYVVKLDYSLSHHAWTLLWIGLEFVEHVYDDVPIDEELGMWDFDIESKEKNVIDPNMGEEAFSLDVDDDMDEAWSIREC